MAKNKRSSGGSGSSGKPQPGNSTAGSSSASAPPDPRQPPPAPLLAVHEWAFFSPRGRQWLLATVVVGCGWGFWVGSAGFGSATSSDDTSSSSSTSSFFRRNLARSVRSTTVYGWGMRLQRQRDMYWHDFIEWGARVERDMEVEYYKRDPANPRLFAVLREAVVRENGGYVHPDLGTMHPAPCGSVRGIGMVRDRYYQCQKECFPSTEKEKLQLERRRKTVVLDNTTFPQEEILIRVPLKFQITRTVALDFLVTHIPEELQTKFGMKELDDFALLVLYLAHERGVGKYSRWLPYIASLPKEPTCGFSQSLRIYILDAVAAYKNELGVDTNGWVEELHKAMLYAKRIAEALNADYGPYLESPYGVTSLDNIEWALCQVSSRATAGSKKHGTLRLVPLFDLINHDIEAGGFVELSGTERLDQGDFVDAVEEDSGAIVVRSLRHGRLKPLRKGQELLVNYNVPQYSPLDWLVAMGFVPRERWGPWRKIDAVLPQIRRDGPFAEDSSSTEDLMKAREEKLLFHLRNSDL